MPRRELDVNERQQAEVLILRSRSQRRRVLIRPIHDGSDAVEGIPQLYDRRERNLLLLRAAPRLRWLPFANYKRKHLYDFSGTCVPSGASLADPVRRESAGPDVSAHFWRAFAPGRVKSGVMSATALRTSAMLSVRVERLAKILHGPRIARLASWRAVGDGVRAAHAASDLSPVLPRAWSVPA